MKIYTCKDRLEDILTCIYDAWSAALQVGHDLIQLRKEPVFQQTIFDEYIHVNGDTSKAEKVIRSIRRDISDEAYLYVYLSVPASWICHRKQCIGAICESICDADRRTAEKSWKRMSSFPGICTI